MRLQNGSRWPEAVSIFLQRAEGQEQAFKSGLCHHGEVSPQEKIKWSKEGHCWALCRNKVSKHQSPAMLKGSPSSQHQMGTCWDFSRALLQPWTEAVLCLAGPTAAAEVPVASAPAAVSTASIASIASIAAKAIKASIASIASQASIATKTSIAPIAGTASKGATQARSDGGDSC